MEYYWKVRFRGIRKLYAKITVFIYFFVMASYKSYWTDLDEVFFNVFLKALVSI